LVIGLVAVIRPQLKHRPTDIVNVRPQPRHPSLIGSGPAQQARQLGDVGGDPPEPRRGSAAWALTSSLDHLVGKLLELRWHIKAESCGGLRQDCCPLNASGRPTLPDQSRSLFVTDCTDVGRRPPRQINHGSLSTRWLCYQEAGAKRGDNGPNALHHSNSTQPSLKEKYARSAPLLGTRMIVVEQASSSRSVAGDIRFLGLLENRRDGLCCLNAG
jgi:hypothetical protein